MPYDLENLSRRELQELIKEGEKALKTLVARRKLEAKRAVEEALSQYGFSVDEVLNEKIKGSKSAPKYANPEDPKQTWTGRGRKPNWLLEAIEKGKKLEDLSI